MHYVFSILTCLFIFSTTAKAICKQDTAKLEFDLTLRERFELWDGMNAKNYGNPDGIGSLNDKILFQRVITGFTFKPNNQIYIAAHIQDSRAFGWSLRNSRYPNVFRIKEKNTETPYYTMNPNEEFLEIYDLYAEFKNFLPDFRVKVGRQKISFGDNRVFGPGDGSNTGRWTWDALRLSYKNPNYSFDIFAGGTKIHNPERISIPFTETEHWGGGLYGHIELNKIAAVEPFYAIKTQGSADYIRTLSFIRHWIGTRIFSNTTRHFDFDFTLVQELGRESGKTINAFGFVGLLGYQFHSLPAKPKLCFRESYASGGSSSDERVRTFDPIFGAKDSYYGRMNITSWSNLDDREIVLYLYPLKDLKLEVNYHWFYIPAPADASLLGTIKLLPGRHHLGNEFNTYVSYKAGKRFHLVGVYGYFWAGAIQPINGTPAKNSSWFAIQSIYQIDGLKVHKHKTIN